MFGYVIVAVMFWFVGDVVDNVIVGFVICFHYLACKIFVCL